ncbi:MAG TPA: sugar transferase [Steroidobacteraceae bacterium]|nr:sugar transferase [Steroidobacteraceae bacterium]
MSKVTYPSKRLFDLAVASAACVAIAPVLVGISAAIWLEDKGSPVFKQPRAGQARREFTILKFRSMRDQRVTRVGHWLRQSGLDELPQFINVCRGEMSVVGPRPLTQGDIDRLGWGDAAQDWRFQVKPGITGLSQMLAGGGARTSERLDRLYLKKQSPLLDAQLVALSIAVNVLGKRKLRRWLRSS